MKKEQTTVLTASKRYKKRSQSAQIWHNFRKNKGALIGICVLLVMIVATIVTGFVVDYNTQVVRQVAKERLQYPGAKHLFGTYQYGRDILIRSLSGAR